MNKKKGFKSDKQRKHVMAKIKNKSRSVKHHVPSRKSQKTKDRLHRLEKNIEDDKQQLKQVNYHLANAKSPDEKKLMKRKRRVLKKRIQRKKQERKKTVKQDSNIRSVMKKTHSSRDTAEDLVRIVDQKGYDVEEIDWEEVKGADLSSMQKQQRLKEQLKEHDV